jgi:hypothetical protein
MRRACLAALLLALATPSAGAQPVQGLYLQGDTGIFFQDAQPSDVTLAHPVPAETPGTDAAERARAAIGGSPALSESGSLGYGLGHGLRVEVQGIHTTGSAPGG